MYGAMAALTNDMLVDPETPSYAKRNIKTMCECVKHGLKAIVEVQAKLRI
jgi:hypothetical protein